MNTQKKRTAKQKRKAVLSVVLMLAILITGAFAFLSATDSKTNVFTIGKVAITLTEKFDTNLDGEIDNDTEIFDSSDQTVSLIDGATILPNQKIIKQPYITNTGNNKAYVYMVVGLPVASKGDVYIDEGTGTVDIAGKKADIKVQAYAIQENYKDQTNAEDIWNAYFDASTLGEEAAQDASFEDRVQLFKTFSDSATDKAVNSNWSQLGSVYSTIITTAPEDSGFANLGYNYYIYAYNELLEVGADTQAIFDKVALIDNIGEAGPVSLNYLVPEEEGNTAAAGSDIASTTVVPEGYTLLKTEYYTVGDTITELYNDTSLAKTGYLFDWNVAEVESDGTVVVSDEALYSNTTITQKTYAVAQYSLPGYINPDEDTPLSNGYLAYSIDRDSNGALYATLIGADSSQDDYPSKPTTVNIPAAVTISHESINELTEGVVMHGDVGDLDDGTVIPVTKIQLAEWQWDSNTNTVMDPIAVDFGKIAKNVVIPASVDSIKLCGDIYQHNVTSGFVLESVNVPFACTQLDFKTFYSCVNLKNIELPNSLTSIGAIAFAYCSNLANIDLPDSVEYIDELAFEECNSLKEITIGSSVKKIDKHVFSMQDFGGSNLERVNISNIASFCNIDSNSLASDNTYLFYNGNRIEDLVIPDGVTEIKPNVFSNYKGMTSITIPDSVNSIGNNAFYNCHVKDINIGSGVKNIDCWAFSYNDVSDLVLPSSLLNIGDSAFNGCVYLTEINIPDNVTTIGENAFRDTSSVRTLKLSNSLKSIGSRAFLECWSITNISTLILPNSLEEIGDEVFWPGTIRELTIGENLKTIGENAFGVSQNIIVDSNNTTFASKDGILYTKDYSKLLIYPSQNPTTDLVLPEGLKTINSTFSGNFSLQNLTIPSTVTEITESITYNTNITSLSVASDNPIYDSRNDCNAIIETATNKLIAGCANTIIPESVTTIGKNALRNCGITEISVPNSITKIESDGISDSTKVNISSIASWLNIEMDWCESSIGTLYLNNSLLTNVTVPEGITSIRECAFRNQSNITNITFSSSVQTIERMAFDNCTGLSNVNIPSNVSKIDSWAFRGCSNLSEVSLNEGLEYMDGQAFLNTAVSNLTLPESLTRINDFDKNITYTVKNLASFCNLSLDFASDGNLLLKHSGSPIENLIIPNGVIEIKQGFNSCQTITSLTIPTSVTSISEYAFNYCHNLTSITYQGTTAQWDSMNVPPLSLPSGVTVTCTDGVRTTA